MLLLNWKGRPAWAKAGFPAVLVALVLAASGLVLTPGPGVAQNATPAVVTATPDPALDALDRAIAYLIDQQGDDGGFIGLSGTSDPGTTADAVVALKAAEIRGVATTSAINTATGYLEDQAAAYAAVGPGQAAKLALAVVAAGRDPSRFGGVDLLAAATSPAAAPAAGTPAATPTVPGVYGTGLYDHGLALLALAAAGRDPEPAAIDVLRATQVDDGSWSFAGTTEPGSGDSNTTALIIQALVATGNGEDPMVENALQYLASVETTTGQFAFQSADPLVADANSTALAVQAIIATGGDSTSADDWKNAARGLAAFQNVSGSFRYQDTDPSDNLLATLQAIPALAGVRLPVGMACDQATPAAAPAGTPIVALPSPSRSEVPCVQMEAAA